MAEKQVVPLEKLFHSEAQFVHMGGTWDKATELKIIEAGTIHYKKAHVYSIKANQVGNSVYVYSDIDLVAALGNNEVLNPFMVTEVYQNIDGTWKLTAFVFSRLSRNVKINE